MKLISTALQLADEVKAVLGKRYPDFVYGGPFSNGRQHVPVFVFHSIQPDVFERHLRYLKENGYSTITCDEYYQWLEHGKSIPEKSVLLAIDDGVESVWQYAYPLLKKYDYRAVVFVIPGYIRHRSAYHYNLQDQWNGDCSAAQVEQRGEGYYNLMYWEELIETEQSGVLDIQSHSLYHHQVFQNNKLTGFFIPDENKAFYDWVIPDGYEEHINQDTIAEHCGMPLYQSDALFRTNKQYLDNADLRNRMVERFKSLGGVDFYRQEKNACKTLTDEYENISKSCPAGEYLTKHEADARIMDNLIISKSLIEDKLNKTVSHLCYPYSFYSEDTIKLSRKAGFKSNFLGTYPGRRINSLDDDPFYTVRVKSDFLCTLPGNNRMTIYSVLLTKLKYRLKGKKYL